MRQSNFALSFSTRNMVRPDKGVQKTTGHLKRNVHTILIIARYPTRNLDTTIYLNLR